MNEALPWLQARPAAEVPTAAAGAPALPAAAPGRAGLKAAALAGMTLAAGPAAAATGQEPFGLGTMIVLVVTFHGALWLGWLSAGPWRRNYYRVGWWSRAATASKLYVLGGGVAWIGGFLLYEGRDFGLHIAGGALGAMAAGALWTLLFPPVTRIPERRIPPRDDDDQRR